MLLTAAELNELTGCKRAPGQIDWLTARAWVFERDAKGKPKVLRSYAEAKLGAKVQPAAPKAWEPDFSDLSPAR